MTAHTYQYEPSGHETNDNEYLYWCQCGGWSIVADHDEMDAVRRGFTRHIRSLATESIDRTTHVTEIEPVELDTIETDIAMTPDEIMRWVDVFRAVMASE